MPTYETPYEQQRLTVLRSIIPNGSGRALDVGCNDGTTTAVLAEKGYSPIGVDIDASVVAAGRAAHPELDLRIGPASEALGDGPFQLVSCFELIEHLPIAAARELVVDLVQALAPGGVFVVSTPGRYSLFSLLDRVVRRVKREREAYDWWDPTHVNVLSWPRLRALLGEAGLHVEHLTGYYYVPARLRRPFAVSWAPANRLGFDLIALCRRVR